MGVSEFSSPFYIPRHVELRLRRSMSHMRVVALAGARQTGKTTLCQKVAEERGMKFVTLDQRRTYEWAQSDPEGFVQHLGRDGGVIDEVQRAPDLMLALKMVVDKDQRPGRFLITGSVDLFRSQTLPDHLAGRLAKVELYPFSQSEVARQDSAAHNFLTQSFNNAFPYHAEFSKDQDLWSRSLWGGYPQVLALQNAELRHEWLVNYGKLLSERYVQEDFAIYKSGVFQRIIGYIAGMPGGIVNLSSIGRGLGVNSQSVDRWLWLLENMFIICRLPVWHHHALKRLTKSPKVYFLDTGLLSALNGWTILDPKHYHRIKEELLESFVFAELTRLLSAHPEGGSIRMSYFRDKSGREVDFVLSRGRRIVAIEVKASTSPSSMDFKGLRYLKEQLGEDFICGVLLYDGDVVHRHGDRVYAVPVQQLWS